MRAIAGAGECMREKRCQPLLLPVFEVLDAVVIELLIDPAHCRLPDRMAQPPGAEDGDPQRLGIDLDRPPPQPAPCEAAPEAWHRLLEVVDDQGHDRQLNIPPDAPERDAGAVVELEPVR